MSTENAFSLLWPLSYNCCFCGRKACSVILSFRSLNASASDRPFFTAPFGVV